MEFAKIGSGLLVACLAALAIGQSPPAKESTKLKKLHDQRIKIYSEMLELAQARGTSVHAQLRKLILVEMDAAMTRSDRISLAEELAKLCRQQEQLLRETVPDDTESMLSAIAERIEAEILLESLRQEEDFRGRLPEGE